MPVTCGSKILRKGGVVPLMALMLPVAMVLAGLAINIAYMQLVSSETKIVADAAAHAGGRAMSIHQSTADAIEMAQTVANLNYVGGQPVQLTESDADDDIAFGLSSRQGIGRYEFTRHSQSNVDAGVNRATSLAVTPRVSVPVIFRGIPGSVNVVNSARRSIATQVDRDIALVLDRSGSMLYYENETALTQTINDLYDTWIEVEVEVEGEGYYEYKWYKKKNKKGKYKKFRGWGSIEFAATQWDWNVYDPSTERWEEGETTTETETVRAISATERDNALEWLYDRRYSDNLIEQLATVNSQMADYAEDWETMIESASNWDDRTPAPRYSRWAFLVNGVDSFLSVLEATDQEEQVALVTFNNGTYLHHGLLKNDYNPIRSTVAGIVPYNGTAVGDGMLLAKPELTTKPDVRMFAAKTIVALTDGESNTGSDPVTAAQQIVADEAITIHTVTFATDVKDALDDMDDVAEAGNGVHYHADTGPELVEKFEEIANNLPTILTE